MKVDVRLHTTATKALIDEIHPDVLITAEGSTPAIPKVDGIEKAVLAQDVLLGKQEVTDNIVVIGGGLVGCEVSLHLAMQGKKVTIVEALPDILKSGITIPPMNNWMLRDLLNYHHVSVQTDSMLSAVTDDGAVVKRKDGQEELIKASKVLLAIGYRSRKPVYDECCFDFAETYVLGDSKQVKNIRNAIWDGYEVARGI